MLIGKEKIYTAKDGTYRRQYVGQRKAVRRMIRPRTIKGSRHGA